MRHLLGCGGRRVDVAIVLVVIAIGATVVIALIAVPVAAMLLMARRELIAMILAALPLGRMVVLVFAECRRCDMLPIAIAKPNAVAILAL
ncbi:hypothetical protein UB46_01785 [Burkholderiaceae bacterium 16]|nr:hypothetical protein UB46_01785 [Burkholderiaceae bacterium 16]